jgi:hypothetical protein
MRFGIQGEVSGNADNNTDELLGGAQRAADAGLGSWVAELRAFGDLGAADVSVAAFEPSTERARTTALPAELTQG